MSENEAVVVERKPEFTFSLIGHDPYCIDYIFKVDTEAEEDSPRLLEYLNVAIDILTKSRENVQNAVLHRVITQERDARKGQRSLDAAKIEKEFEGNAPGSGMAH